VPTSKSGLHKHWWTPELEDLKQKCIDVTGMWKSAGILFIVHQSYRYISVCSLIHFLDMVFRLDALAKALSVIATATWLAGWLAGWVAGWLGVRHTPVLYQNG